MPRVNAPIYSLNGGEVGREALSRLDLERLQFAGALYENILPRVVGPMTLRPGFEHIADIGLGNVELLEYAYSGSSSFVPILSSAGLRVVKDRQFISREGVSTSVTNGDFSSFTGWTNASQGGANATASGGLLVLTGTTQNRAAARQAVSVAGADLHKEHALRVIVARGPVSIRVGSVLGADDLIQQAVLDDGVHSLAFSPAVGTIYIELFTDHARQALVDLCQFEPAGVMVIPSPWGETDLADKILRYRQNKDVLYVASRYYQQREIQRRGPTSWGIQRYKIDDGPYTSSDGLIALQPSSYTGNGTLTATRNYFDPGMVGRLFRIYQSGQTIQEGFTTGPAEGAAIRVSGVGEARAFDYGLSGTWAGEIILQVATDDGSGNPGAWTTLFSRTANTYGTHRDPDDNVIKYFRWRAASITSGTAIADLFYTGGSGVGTARMTGYVSPTVANIEVLERFVSTSASFEWDASIWSDYTGWPWAVETFGGRLFWGQGDFIYGSVPDAYRSFNDAIEGDSAPIARSIGAGTDRGILWLLGLQRLIAGTDGSEVSVKSSSFDEPLTAGSWFPVESSTQGSAALRAVKCDQDGIFVQSSGTSVFGLAASEGSLDYGAVDLTEMHEEICDGSPIVDVAVQRRPDTVVWFVLANGEARTLTYRPSQKVVAWGRVVTEGQIKRVVASRGAGQDDVYFAVVRNGTQRLERLADLKDCKGGAANCLADGFARFTATSGQTSFAVPHLNGLDVTVWANGKALHDQASLYRVSGNVVVLPPQVAGTQVVIGLPYVGRWKSTKLAYGAGGGTALFHKKRVSRLGMYLINTMLDGLRVGNDFSSLLRLTTTNNDAPIPAGKLWSDYDADMMAISSDWDTDSRVCIEARTPYPFTAASLVLDVTTHG